MAEQKMLLPKLDPNRSKFKPGNPSGAWLSKDKEFLKKLSDSMAVKGGNARNISSIPDVWAKPLMFKAFLVDEHQEFVNSNMPESVNLSTALSKRVVGEWRCILAMVALHKMKNIDLQVMPIKLDPSDAVLYRMKPDDSASIAPGDAKWDEIYIFKVDITGNGCYRTFAMTSPASIVASAANYPVDLADSYLGTPWLKEENDGSVTMVDPINGLNPIERAYLREWLANLIDYIATHPNRGDVNGLCNCLQNYIDDIDKVGCYNGIKYETQLSDLNINGILSCLNTVVKPSEASAMDSSVQIVCSSSSSSGKALLLVDEYELNNMAAEWNADKRDLIIWKGITANDIINDRLNYQDRKRIGKELLADTEWVCPDDFFTDYVYTIAHADVFKNIWDPGAKDSNIYGSDISVIPPLKKWILEFFSVEDIKKRFRIKIADDNLVVEFDLLFNCIKGDGTEALLKHTIKKAYGVDSPYLINVNNAPLAEIWPANKIKNWEKYYFCYIDNTELEEKILRLEPWSIGNYKNDNSRKSAVENTMTAINYAGQAIDYSAKHYTARIKAFPEVLLCSAYMGNNYNISEAEVGLLIIDQPKNEITNKGARWKVGIDFGTSNTMIYHSDDDTNSPKPLNFETECYSLMKSSDSTKRSLHMTSYFIRPLTESDKSNGSFLTLFNPLNYDINETEKIEAVIDGHIFSLVTDESNSKHLLSQDIITNLKWDTTTKRRFQAQAYLEQVCLNIIYKAAVSGASDISWNFSYPTAFSEDDLSSFKGMIKAAVREALADTSFVSKEVKIPITCESVATAMYFNYFEDNSRTSFTKGGVCLDIGAGTTDFTVVSARRADAKVRPHIIYHASINYAGRELFNAIYAWLEVMLTRSGKYNFNDIKNPSKKMAMLDTLIREFSETYMEQANVILSVNNDDKVELEKYLRVSQVAVAGLFFYIGLVIRSLHNAGIFCEDNVPPIFLGGNGSRIIPWIAGATDDYEESSYIKMLGNILVAGADLDKSSNFAVKLSREAKIEVAAGMLHNLNEEQKKWWYDPETISETFFGNSDSDVAKIVVAGDSWSVDGEKRGAYDFMTAGYVDKGVYPDNADELAYFIEKFNTVNKGRWGEPIDFEMYRDDVVDKAQGHFMNEIDRGKDNIRLMPVFIAELKALVECMMK